MERDEIFKTGLSRTYLISVSATFGALSAILAILPLSFSFPILPYLKFDIAEFPVVIAFLLYGPIPGMLSATVYWLVLNLVGSFVPIGPAMKFASVVSMLLGMWIAFYLFRRLTGRKLVVFVSAIILGTMLRIVVMSILNYIVLYFLFPYFLEFAANSLSKALGYSFSSQIEVLILTLIITAVFNALHTIFSVIPSFVVVNNLLVRGNIPKIKIPWIVRFLRNIEKG